MYGDCPACGWSYGCQCSKRDLENYERDNRCDLNFEEEHNLRHRIDEMEREERRQEERREEEEREAEEYRQRAREQAEQEEQECIEEAYSHNQQAGYEQWLAEQEQQEPPPLEPENPQ